MSRSPLRLRTERENDHSPRSGILSVRSMSSFSRHPTSSALRSLVAEYASWELLDRRGVPRRQRILFHGPAGCGKTSAVEALPTEIGLPLVLVRIDAVVFSYLGETAAR